MEVKTAKLGWCMAIERSYGLMSRQASATTGQAIYAAHRPPLSTNADLDTLHRIAQGDSRLLDQYPALQSIRVLPDPSTVPDNAALMLGYHGLSHDTMRPWSTGASRCRHL
jgi:hypothetical protein